MGDPFNQRWCDERHEAIEKAITDMRIRIHEDMDKIANKMDKVHEILTGDGQIGLIGEVRENKGRIARIEKTMSVVRSGAWQLIVKIAPWAITAAAAAGAAGWTLGSGN